MSRRHYIDLFSDTDAETFNLLGSRFAKITAPAQQVAKRRGEGASNGSDYAPKLRKAPRIRPREWLPTD